AIPVNLIDFDTPDPHDENDGDGIGVEDIGNQGDMDVDQEEGNWSPWVGSATLGWSNQFEVNNEGWNPWIHNRAHPQVNDEDASRWNSWAYGNTSKNVGNENHMEHMVSMMESMRVQQIQTHTGMLEGFNNINTRMDRQDENFNHFQEHVLNQFQRYHPNQYE
ncbi:hypothetical protein A2U01_0018445, partial [Trifolium medium]|nr:hypothetical protein [Trifolium medium]